MKIAVTVNEMSKVNVDAELVKQDGGLSRTDEKLVGTSNGFFSRRCGASPRTSAVLRSARESAAARVEQPTQISVTDWSQGQIFEFSSLSPRLTRRSGG